VVAFLLFFNYLTGMTLTQADPLRHMFMSCEINYSMIKNLDIKGVGKKIYFVASAQSVGERFCYSEITILNDKKEEVGLGRQTMIITGTNKQLVEALKIKRHGLAKFAMVPKL